MTRMETNEPLLVVEDLRTQFETDRSEEHTSELQSH